MQYREVLSIMVEIRQVQPGDYQLQSTSPLIDAGSNPAVQSAWDIIGNKRIWGEKIDIGAFEYITKE